MDLKLHYKNPATKWVEALPLGNGRIGAMVHGGNKEEIICLNEDTLWSGYPQDHNKKNVSYHIKTAAELAMKKQYLKAQEVLQSNVPGDYTQAYMPMGNLKIKTDHLLATNYSRELNICNAVHTVRYNSNGVNFKKECFISHPNQILVYRISGDKKASVSCEISFESLLRHNVSLKDDCIKIEGICPSHADPSYLNSLDPIKYYDEPECRGIRFRSIVKVDIQNGNCFAFDDKISVENSDVITIYLSVRSNFASFDKHPEFSGKEYIKPAAKDIEKALEKGFERLKEEHINDYKKYYDRVFFSLGYDEKASVPIDVRLQDFKTKKDDIHLPVYLFQYGRYLMISSSRKGSQATNLQGIWSNSLLPPWSSNYTLNINTQMNYWCVFMANLAEFNEPLVDLIEDLSIAGKTTAKEYYGTRGFVAHHNTDIWRLTNPVGKNRDNSVKYSFWNMSTGWLCEHLFEQFEYTQDINFLKNKAYPIMKSSALFYLDNLVIDENGYYVMSPTTSPENGFIIDGEMCAVAKTATMTTSVIKELFSNCIKACDILNKDNEFKAELGAILPKLYPFEIGESGKLLEWNEDFTEEDSLHRHISHLYALHPARLITPFETPKLAEACKKVLEVKGLTGTGWSLAWKVNQWARLLNGDMALQLIHQQLNLVETEDNVIVMSDGGSYPNLLDAHPPFQIDGNFGIVSGICEMLLQSYDDKILILPALPKDWSKGEVKGLCAKNNIKVDIKWKNGKAVFIKLLFNQKCKVKIFINNNMITVDSEKLQNNCFEFTA